MATKTSEAPIIPLPRLRWRAALGILLLMALALAAISWEPEFLHGMQTIATAATLMAAGAALGVWFAFFSGLTRRVRVTGVSLLAALLALTALAVRLEGFDGAMRPLLAWRWRPTAEQRFLAQQANQPGGQSAPVNAGLNWAAVTRHDFPGYLGEKRLGIVEGVSLSRDWSTQPPRELWRREVGLGWSSFAIVAEYAVTQEQRGDAEVVVCYDLQTGRQLWVHADAARFSEVLGGDGPRATPTVHAGRVYALGATGILNCLDGSTGKPLWSRDILAENDAKNIDWGMAGSPLIIDGLAIVCPGGLNGRSVVAYRHDTGEPVWHSGSDRASYVSPHATHIEGVAQVLSISALALESRQPHTGKLLWRYEWAPSQVIKCSQPAVLGDFGNTDSPNRVLLSSGYGVGSILVEVHHKEGAWHVQETWQSRQLRSKFSNLLIHNGYVYALDEGILSCVDLADGKRIWKQGRYGYGQLLLVGDLLLIQAESGEVVLVEASPKAHRELGRLAALSSKTWNPPALAGRRLLVRNDREAACFELPTEESTAD